MEMVAVQRAYKAYELGGTNVINDLSLTVQRGTIYGLLGPSGCGKTTLLSCIIGRRLLDAGSIRLGIDRRHQLGYMPQEVALFPEFTIMESFTYYGHLYSLTAKRIKTRTDELIEFLELPSCKTVIATLSGGQQRRVSFAVALFHDPELLILDEPTAGVDPILCHSIWEFMLRMTTLNKKTIILTTHYIEEARQAHTIGLMRDGLLLAENSPSNLMAAQNCSTLEEVFLTLSYRDTQLKDYRKEVVPQRITMLRRQSVPFALSSSEWWDKDRFLAQLFKNICWLKRNVPIMVFLLLLPAMQTVLYNLTFGRNPRGLILAVVAQELSNGLDDCDLIFYNKSFADLPCIMRQPLSCQLLHYLRDNRSFHMLSYAEVADAKAAVRENKAWAVLHFSENYTDSLMDRIHQMWHTTDTSLELSELNVWLDMSNYIIGNILKRDIMLTLVDFLKAVFANCGMPIEGADIPVKFNDAVFGHEKITFGHSALPGFICSFSFYFTMLFTSGAIMLEKLVGLLDRSMVTGLTMVEVVSAHVAVQTALMISQIAIMFFVLYFVFDNPMMGSFILLIPLILLVAWLGMCYGFLLTEIFSTEKMSTYAGTGSALFLFMMTGIIWPMEGQYWILRMFHFIMPVIPAVQSYHSIVTRAYDISHPNVYKGFISCFAWIFIFIFLTFITKKMNRFKCNLCV